MEERSHYVKGHAIEMRMSIIWVCGRMELHLHGMERSYGFESRQYPVIFGLLEARALPRQIGMGCGYQIPTTLLPTPSINDGTVKLPGLGSRRGWFESSSVHYPHLYQLVR